MSSTLVSFQPLPFAYREKKDMDTQYYLAHNAWRNLLDTVSHLETETRLCSLSRLGAHFNGHPDGKLGYPLTQKHSRSETLDRLRTFCADKNLDQTGLDVALRRLRDDLVEDVSGVSAPLVDLRDSLRGLVQVLLDPLDIQTRKRTIITIEPPRAWCQGYCGQLTKHEKGEQNEKQSEVEFRNVEWPAWAEARLAELILPVQPYTKQISAVPPRYGSCKRSISAKSSQGSSSPIKQEIQTSTTSPNPALRLRAVAKNVSTKVRSAASRPSAESSQISIPLIGQGSQTSIASSTSTLSLESLAKKLSTKVRSFVSQASSSTPPGPAKPVDLWATRLDEATRKLEQRRQSAMEYLHEYELTCAACLFRFAGETIVSMRSSVGPLGDKFRNGSETKWKDYI